MVYSPVIVFCYKRVSILKKCIESLEKCVDSENTDLFIFSDGNKNDKDLKDVMCVRDFLKTQPLNSFFKSVNIIEQPCNIGLAKSIITGVTSVSQKYDRFIVVEDDLIVSTDFIQYMNNCLEYYKNDNDVGAISSYTYPLEVLKAYNKDVYAIRKSDCWGWGTWTNRWKQVDWELKTFDSYLKDKRSRWEFSRLEAGLEEQLINQHTGKLDAWAARWLFHLFNNNMLTIYPKECRSINIGFDGSGENCLISDFYNNKLNVHNSVCLSKVSCNKQVEKEIRFFRQTFFYRLKQFIKDVLRIFFT